MIVHKKEALTAAELRPYLIAALQVSSPPLTRDDAIKTGQIETLTWDLQGRNVLQLLDLATALSHLMWSNARPHTWHEVDYDYLAKMVQDQDLARVALLRVGIYGQVDADTGRLVYSSAPRGIGAHRVQRINLDGLGWDGSSFEVLGDAL